tara:strand:- start:2525 stop:3538 length:1014 start_codon:yes stop_codon:yes gene_type:complete
MILNNKVLEDPLNENALPLFATKLKINHHSPTQASLPDGAWLFKYLVLTQEQRRMLPSNANMKAGVAVNEILQQYYGDTIWKLNPLTKKLMPYANALQYADKQELITKNLDKFKEYDPVDDKDREKFEKYQAEIPDVSLHGFSALEKLGAANLGPIVCEEQISITQSSSPLLLSVVGRTDFAFGGSLDATIPSLIVELKTSWSKLGKIRKDGSRGFISLPLPAAPSFNHLTQCAFYAAKYNYEAPVALVYLTKAGYQIFNKDNCWDLTPEGLQKNFRLICNVFKRREKILAQFEKKDAIEIIKGAASLIDPNFDHPWAWFSFGDENLKQAKQLWNFN